jgi:hypothetical protein
MIAIYNALVLSAIQTNAATQHYKRTHARTDESKQQQQ